MLENAKTFCSYSVTDLPKAKQFYSDVLGLNVVENIRMGILELCLENGVTIMLYPKSDHQPATFTVLNFSVSDVDAVVEQLIQKGVHFEQYGGNIQTNEKGIHRSQGMSVAWFKDPFGNVLSIVSAQ